jgi:hypothetical protein
MERNCVVADISFLWGVHIEQPESTKFFGLQIDELLNLKNYIKQIILKLSRI